MKCLGETTHRRTGKDMCMLSYKIGRYILEKKEENEECKVKLYLEFIGLSAKVLKGASFGLILSWVARENYSLVELFCSH